MKSNRRSFHPPLFITKIFLFFTFCFSAPLSHGVDKSVYKNLSLSVAEIYNHRGRSYGSGFFITENLLVTNYHVIEELAGLSNTYAEVRVPQKMVDRGRVLVVDPKNDLAIIKTQRSDYTPLLLGSHRDIIRDARNLMIGYFYLDPARQFRGVTVKELSFHTHSGTEKSVKMTFSEGVIRSHQGRLFTTTSPIEVGGSGSPVFSKDFKVIGVARGHFYYSHETTVIPIRKLKNLIVRNKKPLQRRGGIGLDHIYRERGNVRRSLGRLLKDYCFLFWEE